MTLNSEQLQHREYILVLLLIFPWTHEYNVQQQPKVPIIYWASSGRV